MNLFSSFAVVCVIVAVFILNSYVRDLRHDVHLLQEQVKKLQEDNPPRDSMLYHEPKIFPAKTTETCAHS